MFVSYRPHVDVQKLSRNTKVVAEALARVIYNLTEKVNARREVNVRTLDTLCAFLDVTCCVLLLRGLLETCRSSLNRW